LTGSVKMRVVPINSVREGHFLGKTIYDADGKVLLKQGVRLSDPLIDRIKKLGIQTIYINDEFSDNEIEEIIKPEIKLKAIKSVKNLFDQIKGKKDVSSIKSKNSRNPIYRIRDQQMESMVDVSKSIVEDVLSNNNTMINLVDIKTADNYTYEHSVNVAVLSLVLGIELGLNRNQLNDLCVGALLHDIGKAFTPREILAKPGPLSDSEYKIIKEHPVKGYEYIKGNPYVTSAVKVIVYEHHERADGTGYPRGIKDEGIHILAKILSVVDVYDALTSDRPYRKAVSPNEALELIMGSAGRQFNFDVAEAFVRKVVPYPVGSLVKLSNGDVGVVESTRPNFPLRPTVRIIRQNPTGVDMEIVDLMKESNLVIEGMQYEIPNHSIPYYLKNFKATR